ncbi:methyltransferase domain-containing protein [Lichenicoccus sp.]|uniref:methyltransferase domain-containing protein n=1 Tax=Lichenicoccus sp. TaxID=2781899 RepID=UPI003D09C060
MSDDLDGFHPRAFDKADASPDSLFYAEPRFVTHLDDAAIRAVTALYRTVLPEGGVILDLMSSWVSHLPEEMAFEQVIGHGMNEAELAANTRLDRYFVRDLNREPSLPLADHSLDAACLCVGVQYLQYPVTVFRDLARCLRPQAPLVISFSDRCFPTKAVAIWQALDNPDRQRLLATLLGRAGFGSIETGAVTPDADDPDWRDPIFAVTASVIGRGDAEI